MREIRQSGSVRGVWRNPYPYRDLPIAHAKHGAFRSPRRCCPMEPLKQQAAPKDGSRLAAQHRLRAASVGREHGQTRVTAYPWQKRHALHRVAGH